MNKEKYFRGLRAAISFSLIEFSFSFLGAVLDDKGAHVVTGLLVVGIVRSVTVGKLAALPASAKNTLKPQKVK
jgi:hypothetical protein